MKVEVRIKLKVEFGLGESDGNVILFLQRKINRDLLMLGRRCTENLCSRPPSERRGCFICLGKLFFFASDVKQFPNILKIWFDSEKCVARKRSTLIGQKI